MSTRSLLLVTTVAVTLALSSAMGGFVSRDGRKSSPAAPPEPPLKTGNVEPVATSGKSADSSDSAEPARDNLGQEKALLGRLVKDLQRSSRSFLYLRSVGYTKSDQEFEEIINQNNAIFRRTRIIRRDEQGNRQIPGWPGVSLTKEYQTKRR